MLQQPMSLSRHPSFHKTVLIHTFHPLQKYDGRVQPKIRERKTTLGNSRNSGPCMFPDVHVVKKKKGCRHTEE